MAVRADLDGHVKSRPQKDLIPLTVRPSASRCTDWAVKCSLRRKKIIYACGEVIKLRLFLLLVLFMCHVWPTFKVQYRKFCCHWAILFIRFFKLACIQKHEGSFTYVENKKDSEVA